MTSSDDAYGTAINAFSPSTVTIVRNGTVTWSNNSGVTHNVTFGQASGSPTNIPNLAAGSAARSFPSTGTFSYQCTNHQGMGGQVIVQ
jgi:plastocyanin